MNKIKAFSWLFGALVMLAVALGGVDGWAAAPERTLSSAPEDAEATDRSALPAQLTAAQARDLLARMSDGEARELLLRQLETPHSEAEAQPAAPASMVFDIQASMYAARNRLRLMFAALPELPSLGPFMAMRITKGYDPSHIWAIGGYLLVIFAAASAGEVAFRRMFRPLVRQIDTLDLDSEFRKLGILLLRALIELLAIAAFAAIASAVFLMIYKGHEVARIFFWSIVAFVIVVRLGAVALDVLLAPRRAALRLPDLDDAAARRLYVGLLVLTGLAAGSAILSNFLAHIGAAPGQLLAATELLLLVNVAGQIAFIWTQRTHIGRFLGLGAADAEGAGGSPKGIEALFSRYWHIFAVTLLFAMSVFATVRRLLTGEIQVLRVLPTLAVLIALPLIDGLLRMTVRRFFGARGHPGDGGATPPDGALTGPDGAAPAGEGMEAEAAADGAGLRGGTADDTGYERIVLRNGRILLALVGAIALAGIWDLSLEAMAARGLGARVAGSLFDIVVTLILASAAWGVIRTAINRNLPREGLDALALAEGEIGGSGVSRLETLLPLLRKFLYIALIAVVALIVISSMGIDIGPLLAGAGVVGIAVGFGAQTLVRDVISGIFFLVDDAFRVGEYIDVGEGKGTVERMSVRALMLRHHLGQIHTIPFGAIRRVTNYSRDWVIMKLEMRVPFETDLEKVRKLVKRVGTEMMADPTFGSNFIQPLKSQGVHHMDDSSFVIRVKFMARPGEQFVLRREVFRRLQEAFRANGINFAPRRVIVESADAPSGDAAAAAADTAAERPSPAT